MGITISLQVETMKINIKPTYDYEDVKLFAATTTHGKEIKASKKYWFKTEHSPIRLMRYIIHLTDIKTFISVHLVRHSKFAEHGVLSKRDDLRPDPNEQISRNTPVNHCIETNAQELINISRKRLCYKSHKETVAVWKKITKQIKKVEPDLYPFLVPECVYRNGICPEFKECKPTLQGVMKAYNYYPLIPIKPE